MFILMFFMICHVTACLWLIIAQFQNEDASIEGTWVQNFEDEENIGLYFVSFYWTITTITTVGYGDISGTNLIERIFCSLIMVVGVIAFSFANGALASMLT